jgi:hypothetical protein
MSHHPTAKDVFIAKKAAIDAMLARLQALGHVGNLEYYAELLKRITDSAFKEGEHAE